MNELTEQILRLQQGDHLCLIYEKNPAEQMPALVPFIQQGLASGERCIYIADDQTVDEVARALEANGIDVGSESKRGALILWTREEWRQPGELDSDKKADQVQKFIDAAFSAGFKGIRFAVEMTWTLGPAISAERLRHWEATINKIFVPGFPGRIICQYNRSRLSPEVVQTSLSTHPLAIIGHQVYPNLFYEAPLILEDRSETDRLDWMISQLNRAYLAEKGRTEQQDQERYRKLRRIYELNNRVNRAEALEEVYKASLDSILQLVGANRAAILLMGDDQLMRFKAWSGISEGYRRAVEGHSPWRPDETDPKPVCISNIDHEPLDERLRGAIRHEGIRAIGFFPLVYQKRLLGKFMVYYDSAHGFLEEEMNLVQTIAGHIAFSIGRKRAEEALRQSEERLNIALGAGRMGAWEWDIPTGRITWTPSLEVIHGVQPGTFGGRFDDFKRDIHPEDLDRVFAAIDRTLREGSEYQIEYRILRPAGSVAWLESRGQLFFDEAGAPRRLVGVCMDVTGRKQMEVKLRRSEENLTDFFENAITGLHWVGPDGAILWANRAEMEMLGYRPEEYLGRHIAEFHADRDVIDDILKRLGRGETIHNREARLRCQNGAIKHVLIDSNVLWEDGKFIHTRCFTRDITERKRAEEERERLLERERKAREEAQAANRLKDDFLATVSHELRTPLNAIYGWTRLLRAGDLDKETCDVALETIERNTNAQVRLIDDLLDVSRIITGKLRMDVRPVEPSPVVDAAIDAVRPAAKAKSIMLQTALSPAIGLVWADADRLQQVVWNLLSNAIKFTPEGGRVEVRLERVDPYIQIKVSDTGIGIEAGFLPYVFDRFRQAEAAHTRLHGGLGLGLAIVRHLTELHGGTVQAESPGEGKGATFTVRLPMMAARVKSIPSAENLSPMKEKLPARPKAL